MVFELSLFDYLFSTISFRLSLFLIYRKGQYKTAKYTVKCLRLQLCHFLSSRNEKEPCKAGAPFQAHSVFRNTYIKSLCPGLLHCQLFGIGKGFRFLVRSEQAPKSYKNQDKCYDGEGVKANLAGYQTA